MAQYPIPQFIDSEGKIIFFLTFRQFFLLVGGGAVCLFFYYILPFWLFAGLSLIVMGLIAAIAFLKVNNESVVKIFLHFISYSTGVKNYTWQKKQAAPPLKAEKNNQTQNMAAIPMANVQISKLKEIKKTVEIRK